MCTFAGSWGRPSETANPQIFEVRPLFHLQGWHLQALPESPILMNGSLLEFMYSAMLLHASSSQGVYEAIKGQPHLLF